MACEYQVAVVLFAFVVNRRLVNGTTVIDVKVKEKNQAKLNNMAKKSVLNDSYKGLVENFSIPAEIHERDGKKYASFGSVVPIHCCTPEEVEQRAKTTHHYCDIFTDEVLAPLEELVYVRLDEVHAEKVFINRNKRILIVSSDGNLACWRSAPTFESTNQFIAGTPIVNKDGTLVSVVTARRGNQYAVSNFECEGGYFDTPHSWKIMESATNGYIYGDHSFNTREEVRKYISELPSPAEGAITPVLHQGANRIAAVAENGRQVVHMYLHGVVTSHVDYL